MEYQVKKKVKTGEEDSTYLSSLLGRLVKHKKAAITITLEEVVQLLDNALLADEALYSLRGQAGPEGLQQLARAPSVALRESHSLGVYKIV